MIATHGIVKKTKKTPKKEIDKAERMRKEYFDEKTHLDLNEIMRFEISEILVRKSIVSSALFTSLRAAKPRKKAKKMLKEKRNCDACQLIHLF